MPFFLVPFLYGSSHRFAGLALICLSLGLSLGLAPGSAQAGQVQAVLHSLDYIAVDYPATVAEGRVIDAAEYAEQMEFSQHLLSAIPALPEQAGRDQVLTLAQRLRAQIEARAEGRVVADTARQAGQQLAQLYQVRLTPRVVPDLSQAAVLYRAKCASCHGAQGDGDGPAAAKLDPPPINFHDRERAMERSVYGLFSAITLGVAGTEMRAFDELSAGQRWALAFYVGSFAFDEPERAAGESAWRQAPVLEEINAVTQMTPAAVAAMAGKDGLMQLAWLRSRPEVLMQQVHPLDTALERLDASIASYRSGNAEQAYQEAVAAYLEGFELAEASLRAGAAVDVAALEEQMMAYRQQIKARAPLGQLESAYHDLVQRLDQARYGGAEAKLSGRAGAVSAAVILLREGLEAILILAAVAGVLIKTGRRDALPYLHAGWIGALLLGVATWWVSTHVVAIGGANRELTEGLTALLAAAVLVYVGFWLHGKTNAARWREFVEVKIKGALQGRALWALTLVAFLAVYREVFETVLFYQALWLQTEPVEHGALWGGIAAGAGTLLLLAWLILRYSVRLPLRLFFTVNSIILFVLAVAFTGHGIAALQEAGWVPIDPVPLPRLDLLGLYPTLETLLVQLLIAGLIIFILLRERRAGRIAAKRRPA